MKVIINGKEKKLKDGATLKNAMSGQPYVKGTMVSVYMSEEKVTKETSDFEIITNRGVMVLHLMDTPAAEVWRQAVALKDNELTARWVTQNLSAFGSFPTDLDVDRDTYLYKMYDCFLSLGGFDNQTTYMMIAKDTHKGSYGAGHALIGRITVGRHLLGMFREGDSIIGVRPLISETSTENVIVTDDMSFPLEEGYRIETAVAIDLDHESPEAAEHVLVMSSEGTIRVSEDSGSYITCSEDLDIDMPAEHCGVRDRGTVAVRNTGLGSGRIFVYRDRRQMSPAHNTAGQVVSGNVIVSRVKAGQSFTVVTNPPRARAVGMTQKEGEEFLAKAGIKAVRTGDVSDDAIIVEQSPEHTMAALSAGEVEVLGVPRDKVFRIKLDKDVDDRRSYNYFRKVTGLNHKRIGSMKVQFTFEGLPMVTFYGDEMRGKNLFPLQPFKKVKRGDIGLTNQVRPHCGLIGIRLEDSKEFGPTGEESYGTNIIGKFVDDLDRLMDGLEDDDVVYITEEKI